MAKKKRERHHRGFGNELTRKIRKVQSSWKDGSQHREKNETIWILPGSWLTGSSTWLPRSKGSQLYPPTVTARETARDREGAGKNPQNFKLELGRTQAHPLW